MKRLVALIAGLIFAIAIGVGALPWFISSKSIEQRFTERVFELTGLKATYQGEIQLSLQPFLGLELENVEFTDPDKDAAVPLLHLDRLAMQVQLLPLLNGEMKLSAYSFVRPTLNIETDESGKSNWHLKRGTIAGYINKVTDTLAQKAEATANDVQNFEDVGLGQINIADGTINYKNQYNSRSFILTGIDANAGWPSLAAGWQIGGRAVWNGEVFSFFNSTSSPVTLIAGGKSQIEATLESASVAGEFSGDAQFVSGIHLQGIGKIATPSISRLAELLNTKFGSDSTLDEFAIAGKISANTGEVRFDEANAIIDGNNATGLLQLNWQEDSRAKISGTLAFDTLNLTPFIARLPDEPASSDEAREYGDIDFDVRISASQMLLREKTFGLLAATAVVQKEEWSLDIGEAELFGGSLNGTVSAVKEKDQYLLNLKGQVRNLALGELTQSYYQQGTFINGITNAKFDLSTKSHELTRNLQNYSGTLKVELNEGQIVGLDLRKVIPALELEDGVVTANQMAGNTPFTKLSLGILISNGIAWLSKNASTTPEKLANGFNLFGKFDFLRGGLAIYADITSQADNPSTKRIFIGGTFKNPLVTRTPATIQTPSNENQ